MIKTLLALLLCCAAPAPAADAPFFAAGDTKRPEFALTYDDGPGYITEDLLALLEKRGVKAAFFVLGSAARAYPAKVKKLADAGHLVASHTDSHVLWKKEARRPGHEERLAAELAKTAAAIEKAGAPRPAYLRMPNGYDAPWVRRAAGKAGYTIVNWTYGSDWVKVSEEKMEADYLKAVKPGAVILLHDGGGKARAKTLKLTERILDEAARKGLKAVRLDELLRPAGR